MKPVAREDGIFPASTSRLARPVSIFKQALSRLDGLTPLQAGLLIMAAALLVRLPGALWSVPSTVIGAEPINIVRSLITTGSYANAFGPDSGPTAHCLPLNPLLQAGLVLIFGTGSAGAVALVALACLQVSLGLSLLPLLARSCGMGAVTGTAAGLLGALFPVNFWAQTTSGFEAPLASLGLMVSTCLVAAPWTSNTLITFGRAAGLGLAMGLTTLTSSSAIPVFALWGLLGLWRFRSRPLPYLARCATILFVVVSVLAPWALRNQQALGALIWTRPNLGLELQVSNNDQARPNLEDNRKSLTSLHPLANSEQKASIKQLGEVAYNQQKLKLATDWIRQNPGRFLRLTAERIYYFWFPKMSHPIQSALLALLSVFGILGLWRLWRGDTRAFLLFMCLLLGYSAIYSLVQVSARYRFPVEWALLLLGSYAVVQRLSPPPSDRA